MTDRDPERSSNHFSPTEAFSVLGNETRLQIIHSLGASEGPRSFTELRDEIGLRQGGQFNYHLSKLTGHFVAKTEEGYELKTAGRRVFEAILSGVVTDERIVKPATTAFPCPYCGTSIVVTYHEERLELHCTECAGFYDVRSRPVGTKELADPAEYSYLGSLRLPPAGLIDRTPTEILSAAFIWCYPEWLSMAWGVCPRCAGRVDTTVVVCEEHQDGSIVCDTCHMRQQVRFESMCTNCRFEVSSSLVMHLFAKTEIIAFAATRGYNPIADALDWGWEYEEEIISVDPFEGRFTFTIDGDTITVTVDDDLDITDVDCR